MNRHRLRDLRDDRRDYTRKPSRKGLVAKVLLILAAVGLTGLIVGQPGCNTRPSAQTLPPKKSLASLKPKELQQQTTEYAIEGGALAGMKVVKAAPIADSSLPEGGEPVVKDTAAGFVVQKVRSPTPHVLPRDREQAIEETVVEARRVLAEQRNLPGSGWAVNFDRDKVRDVLPDKSLKDKWEAQGLGADRGWVEIDEVTVTHDTLRRERAKERTATAGFWLGTAFLALLAAYGFLRLDMWTKGYLTLILGIVVGGVVVAAVIGLGLLIW
ncbi:MAG: hypothetical protein MUF18_12815 [Fimbriiglobus sp.]|nr:hypothetical protein [Fimbriiglobus sp.]